MSPSTTQSLSPVPVGSVPIHRSSSAAAAARVALKADWPSR